MGFKKKWKKLNEWKKGGVIGFFVGIILSIFSLMNLWAESSFLGFIQLILYGPFLFASYIAGSPLLGLCREMGCIIYFLLGGIISYIIIGIIIGAIYRQIIK